MMKNFFNLRVLTDLFGFLVNVSVILGKAFAGFALAYMLYQAGTLISTTNEAQSIQLERLKAALSTLQQ